jgi:eukaryotic-like serine/threonine-protein kinase
MPQDRRIGQILGAKWRLESVLGAGGTSTVYAATHEGSGERAAVKVLHPELSQRPGVVKILLSEARLVAAIGHPGTVKALDDGTSDDGCAFIVFELLTGQSLEELRQAHGSRIPLQEVMPIGDAVMDALSAVHQAGVVHRDLKPHNIVVLEGGGVKLLDFGLGKQNGRTSDAAQNVFGTPSFMPPEQSLGLSNKIDAQSDVWSLGATLFHVLSGQPVHIARDMTAMMLASASVRPRSLADAAPELPSKVVAVVDRALAYRKADRWPDMAAMRAAWQEAHPHWLPTLPPPKFAADPSYLDVSLLVPEPMRAGARSLFDPRDLLNDSVPPMKHPGALPNAARPPAKTKRRGGRIAALAVAAIVVTAAIASALAVAHEGPPKTRSALPR